MHSGSPSGKFEYRLPATGGAGRRLGLTGLGIIFLFGVIVPTLSAQETGAASAYSDGTTEIAPNLVYRRFTELPRDLTRESQGDPRSLIADLRSATGDASAGAAFLEWLASRARPAAPVYLLLSANTDARLRAELVPGKLPAGIISLAAADPGIAADIRVSVSTTQDREAYAALAAGKPASELIDVEVDKPRNDEAAIVRRRQNGTDETAIPANTRPGARGGDSRSADPLVDAVLERAVQIQAGLTALGRVH